MLRHRFARACFLLVVLAAGCDESSEQRSTGVEGGDPKIGREAIARVACGVCHTIPGVPGARGMVGPPLKGFGERSYIAGVVPNHPRYLVEWIRNAPAIAPGTAMPALPVSEQEARHIAAYLYTLH